jgi:hypothetical protein
MQKNLTLGELKIMKIKILPILIIFSLILAGINVIALENVGTENNNTQQDLVEDYFSFSKAKFKQKGEYIEVIVDEANTVLRVTGKPMIPSNTKTYTFPRGTKIKDVKCTISEVKTQVIIGKIQPNPEPPRRISLVNSIEQDEKIITTEELKTNENPDVYSSSDLYPDRWYDYNIYSGLVKTVPSVILKVNVYPIRYSPSENKIQSIDCYDIQVKYEKSKDQEPTAQQYDLLIITPLIFKLNLQRLASHKNRNGIRTKIKTVESIKLEYLSKGRDDPERIKLFIKDAEQNWGIKYVLLVGGLKNHIYANDRENQNYGSRWWYLPVRFANIALFGSNGYISDLYYADLYKGEGEFEDWDSNGNDIFAEENEEIDLWPDVYYGRLPCRNTFEVRNIVNKIIKYERASHWDENWFKRMIAVGGVTFDFLSGPGHEGQEPDGEWLCNLSLDHMKDIINDPVRIFASYNSTTGPRPEYINITEEWSKGAGFVLLQGHGNAFMWDTKWPDENGDLQWVGGIWSMDFSLIKNRDKLPIVVVGGCHNGIFRVTIIKTLFDSVDGVWNYHAYGAPVGSCFSGNMVQRRSGVAIACTGCTDSGIGTELTFSAELETNFFYKVGIDKVKSLGEAHSGSIEKYLTDNNIQSELLHVYCITEYQLFGDPSLTIGGKTKTSNI